jgi:hypothetical protein
MEPPNERQSLSAASRTIADVEPVRVGWHWKYVTAGVVIEGVTMKVA